MSVQTNYYDLLIETIKLQIHTSLPGRVVRYYSNETPKSADIEILFMQKGKSGQVNRYPMVTRAPVLRHVGTLNPDDIVYLSVAERALDELQKVPFDPDSIRKFDLRDSVIMGVLEL
ncbi:hypothetical protein M4D55_23460 [Metabacillus idriensis]|uniref:hypothetical protein n=1 Tax=Metabacillus idriensis TaxID=324768 RepID=UPI00203B0BF2|nr:hypothetical protein [Metabacillus idriensis]MCM3598721.1 hypothetical protein [Metabacillus idriensis]